MCFKQTCYRKDEMTIRETEELREKDVGICGEICFRYPVCICPEELWKQLEDKKEKEDKMIKELMRK